MAIVAHALIRIAGRALNTAFKKALAVTAFLALFLFAAPFALVVLEASAIGKIVAAVRPDWLANNLRVYVCMDMRISSHIRGADGMMRGLVFCSAEISSPESEIATVTGHSLRDVGSILDARYLKRDGGLAESAIRKLEKRTDSPN